ncbi:MAG: hypothetical protein IIA67_05620 [Planctomycetes bacterium]|nr:hypothetical protein [Planctomycetota bacterium]
MEQAIAAFGKSFDLTTVSNLPDAIELESRIEVTPRVKPLSNTWPVLLLASLLMLGEWTFRKLNNLA